MYEGAYGEIKQGEQIRIKEIPFESGIICVCDYGSQLNVCIHTTML